MYDNEQPPLEEHAITSLPTDLHADDPRIVACREIEILSGEEVGRKKSRSLVEQRQKKLYNAVGIAFIEDNAGVSPECLESSLNKVIAQETLTKEERKNLERKTLAQKDTLL